MVISNYSELCQVKTTFLCTNKYTAFSNYIGHKCIFTPVTFPVLYSTKVQLKTAIQLDIES